MKLNLKERNVTIGGEGERTTFKMEMNAMAFHSVIDGIYSDKVSSPFRELCTNARDGHSANGNLNEPFDVFLPSTMNPIFKVRDYGIGLSHDDVMGMYSTMFASTKRDSNDAVGMIGLGSKSPFAYTSAFSVTSWFEGMERTYSAFIGETGVPEIALMLERESGERGGIEVQFPVKMEDVKRFRDAAPKVLFGFDPFPRILNETFTRTVPVVENEGPNWKMYQNNTTPFAGKLMARQGCVLYPIDYERVKGTDVSNTPSRWQAKPVPQGEDAIYNWSVVIDFPIGSLDVATSRESLGYNSKTISAIKEAVSTCLADMTKLVSSAIEAQPDYLSACVFVSKAMVRDYMSPTAKLYSMLFKHLTYEGTPLKNHLVFKTNHTDTPICWIDPEYAEMGVNRPNISFRIRALKDYNRPFVNLENIKFFVEMPDLKNGPARMRQVVLDAKGSDHIMWMRPTSAAARDAFFASIDNPPWVDLETIEPLMRERTAVTIQALRYYIATTSYDYYSHKYKNITPTTETVYMKQEGQEFFINGKPLRLANAMELVRQSVVHSLIPAGTEIFFLNKMNIKILQEVQMKEISTLVLESLQKMNLHDVATSADAAPKHQRIMQAKKLLELKAPMPKDLTDYVTAAAVEELPKPVASGIMNLAKTFVPDALTDALRKTDPLKDTYHRVYDKYPLLDKVISMREDAYLIHYLGLISK